MSTFLFVALTWFVVRYAFSGTSYKSIETVTVQAFLQRSKFPVSP